MNRAGKPLDEPERLKLSAELRRDVAARKTGYRERALSLFPHLCARCGREFSGKRLRELTIHHKDHDHENNPPDGSNWELLCLYCHDHEHEKMLTASAGGLAREATLAPSIFAPFADLDVLLKGKDGAKT